MKNDQTDEDQIKQSILLETENLKFVQLFFLPVFSGVVIVILTNPDGDFTKIVLTILGAALFLFPLFLVRNILTRRIKQLIKNLGR